MKGGYVFAMANLMDGCVAGYPACLMPMWVKKEDMDNKKTIRAILGSEPKVGSNLEIELDVLKMHNVTYAPIS